MYLLITYDISTTTAAGRKRLRRVAKICQNHGQRVQNSVFECELDEHQFVKMKAELLKTIDSDCDSLRFYRLGKNYRSKVEHVGANPGYHIEDVLIL